MLEPAQRASLALSLWMLCICAAIGCSNALQDDPIAVAASRLVDAHDPAVLQRGRRRVLIEGVPAAENQYFTSTGRLLVTGDEGIYELVPASQGRLSLQQVHAGERCQFGGITELHETVYANCYADTGSTLFASPLPAAGGALSFRPVYALADTSLANGLTNDGHNHLFVASTFDGLIIRLRVAESDPLAIEARELWEADSGFATNGIKQFEDRMYWTSLFSVNAAQVLPSGGAAEHISLLAGLAVYDDLYVDSSGILIADYLEGRIVATDLTGKQQFSTASGVFDGPSSVLPASGRLGLGSSALIVTERGGNRVSVIEPREGKP